MGHLFRNTDDDRVVPMHSFKHAATLQHTLPRNPHPLLLRVDKNAGHGSGKSTEKRYIQDSLEGLLFPPINFLIRIQEAADKWGFVAQSMGLVWQDPSK
jgi:prolyl oligopeptidase